MHKQNTKPNVDLNCNTTLICMVSAFFMRVFSSASFKSQHVPHDMLRLTHVNQQLQAAIQGTLLALDRIRYFYFPESKSPSQLTELSHN